MDGDIAQNYNAARSFCWPSPIYLIARLLLFCFTDSTCSNPGIPWGNVPSPTISSSISYHWDGTDSISPHLNTETCAASPVTSNTREIQFWDFNQNFLPNDSVCCVKETTAAGGPLREKSLCPSGVTRRKEERDGQRPILAHLSICIPSRLMLALPRASRE